MNGPKIDVLEIADDGTRIELGFGNIAYIFHRGPNGRVVKTATINESRIFDPSAQSLPGQIERRVYALAAQIMKDYARRHAARALQTELSIH
jgi:hypothetical protein